MLDYLELTTLLIAIIGLGALIVHNLGKLIRVTEHQTAQNEVQHNDYMNKFDCLKESVDGHDDDIEYLDKTVYLNGNRITTLEEWKEARELEGK